SVAIIVKNEEYNLPRMLESIKWADERVILDTGSTDRTMQIAKEFGAKLYQSEWLGFGKCKQIAVDKCENEWILSLDADEVLSPNLSIEIKRLIASDKSLNGYRIHRTSFYLGRKIKHCGWNRDYTLRLFRKSQGSFNQKSVHESVQIKGEIGFIKQPMLHYTYPTIDSHLEKMKFYSTLSSQELYKKGRTSSLLGASLRSGWKFFQMYFLKTGFLDGKEGFILCKNSGMGIFWKYTKLWELNKNDNSY
ncbi:MAG: glycosyltransferase family 2 protein, partial [Candidatus Zophobacter franzmannii]|nr:glycosyltransferase family 2 protein [Candidatus Zophobacter franzmannii]